MTTATKQPDPAVLRTALKISAIADEHRLGLLLAMEGGPRKVGDLAEMDDAGVSPRLAILRHAGMVEVRREGKFRFYNLTDQGMSLMAGLRPLLKEPFDD
jgi:DNA-binding transcriptional ArsR family regulator